MNCVLKSTVLKLAEGQASRSLEHMWYVLPISRLQILALQNEGLLHYLIGGSEVLHETSLDSLVSPIPCKPAMSVFQASYQMKPRAAPSNKATEAHDAAGFLRV